MSRNIAIDLGNSSAKLYVYDGLEMIAKLRCDNAVCQNIDTVIQQYGVENAIISSVRTDDTEIRAHVEANLPGKLISLSNNTPLPITIAYSTPETLGADRIAVAVGAHAQMPGKNLLIIDLGTAITMDVVDAQGQYLGGNISPGLTTRFRALHEFTGKLPMLDAEGDTPLVGHDTHTAIRSGVLRGVAYEINGYIAEINEKMQGIDLFITGGDAKYLVEWIKYRIFDDQNLLARGLNTILLYNIE